MDYEKKYKELVGKIEKAYLYAQTDSTKAVLEDILPELAESEDERIRKWLEETIESMSDNNIIFKDVRRIDVLHWLEKQGKSKWSDEDTFKYRILIDSIADGRTIRKELRYEFVLWMESLKKRMEE